MKGSVYLGLVARLPCAVCEQWSVEVHHQRAGTGGGRKASDFQTMPLCVEHHRGDSGIHGLGVRAFERTYGVTEAGLVAWARAQLGVSDHDVALWELEACDRADASTAREYAALRGPKPLRAAAPARPKTVWPKRALKGRSSFPSRSLNPKP